MARSTILHGAAACLAAALTCATADAQLFRAYLAADGNDGNPCTLQAPCRLLPAALNAVASGGEIWMLDSANYNTATVNITKSVSILAVPGVVGSIVALNGGSAIDISAAGLSVALRNLVIGPVAGVAPGLHGVLMTDASDLTIENSLIANLPGVGVFSVGGGRLRIANSVLRNNGNYAVVLQGGASAAISMTQMLANVAGGVYAAASSEPTSASISDALIAGGLFGVRAYADTLGATARISVNSSTIERTTAALYSHTNSTGYSEINVGSSMIVDNNNAWSQEGTGSTILSLGNNQMSGNGGSVGVLTPLAAQ